MKLNPLTSFRQTRTEPTTDKPSQTVHREKVKDQATTGLSEHGSDNQPHTKQQAPEPIPTRFSHQIETATIPSNLMTNTLDTLIEQLLTGNYSTDDNRKYRIKDGHIYQLNTENRQWTPLLGSIAQAERLVLAPKQNDVFTIKDGNISSVTRQQTIDVAFPVQQLRHISQQGDLVGISENEKEVLLGSLNKPKYLARLPLHLSSNERLSDATIKDNQLYFIVAKRDATGKEDSQLYNTSVLTIALPTVKTHLSVSAGEYKNRLEQWKSAVDELTQAVDKLNTYQEKTETSDGVIDTHTSHIHTDINTIENTLIEKAISAEEKAAKAVKLLAHSHIENTKDNQSTQTLLQRPFNKISTLQNSNNKDLSLKGFHYHGREDLYIRFSEAGNEFLTKVNIANINTQEASPIHMEQDPARLGTLSDQVRTFLKRANIQPNHYSRDFIESTGLLNALTKRGHISENTIDKNHKRNEIKTLVDELNAKYVQELPMRPSLDLSRSEDLAPLLEKLTQQLSTVISEETLIELRDTLKNLRISAPGKNKKSIDKVILVLEHIKTEASQKTAPTTLKNMREILSILSNHISVDSLQEAKKSLKQDIMKQFQHLEKPGASSFSLIGATIDIPTASPITISIGAEHLEQFRTENYLTILEYRETSGTVLANIGLPRNFGIAAGGQQSVNRMITHRNLEQLADDMADRIFSLVVKSPIKSIFNAKQLIGLYKNVKQHNTSQNQTSILNDKLHQMGLIHENDNLNSISGHQKKLPQKRRRYDTRGLAAGNTQIAGTLGTTLSGTARYEKTHEYDRTKILTTMNKNPNYLEQKVKETQSEIIAPLRQEASALEPANNLKNTEKAQYIKNNIPAIIQHREKIKKEIINNLQSFEHYTEHVQRSDEAYRNKPVKDGLLFVNKLLTKTNLGSQSEDTTNKIQTERDMNVRGRRHTIEKLTVQHAALTQLYNDTYQHALAKPRPNSAVDINERQFKSALEKFSQQFQSPQLTLDNKDLDKLHSLTRVKVEKYATEESISFQAFGLRASLSAEQAYTQHVDPVKTGTELRFNVQLRGTISRASITEIVERIQAQATQQVGQAAGSEASEEVQRVLNGKFDVRLSTGIRGTLELDISLWNGQLDYVRLLSNTEVLSSANIDRQNAEDETSGGTANFVTGTVTVLASQRNNLVDRMGTNNLHYLHLQFNGLMSAKTVTKGNDKDRWNDIVHRYDGQLPKLIENLSNADSQLNNRYLQPLLDNDHGHYTPETLQTANKTLSDLRVHAKQYHDSSAEASEGDKEAMVDHIINDLRDFFYDYNKHVIAGEKKKKAKLLIKQPRLL